MRQNAREVQKLLMQDKQTHRLSIDIEIGVKNYMEMVIRLFRRSGD
jgi:hypothetical protein